MRNFRITLDDFLATSQQPILPGVNSNLKSVQGQNFNKNVN